MAHQALYSPLRAASLFRCLDSTSFSYRLDPTRNHSLPASLFVSSSRHYTTGFSRGKIGDTD